MSFRWYCTPSSFPIQILQTGEKGFFPSFATCFLVSLSLSPPRPHTMTQPKSLLWLATVPKISRENRSLGGLGATAKWPPNHPTFRRALDNNRVVQDPSCPYIYKGRRAEQSTKKKEGRNTKEKKEESRAQKKTQKTKGKRRQRKKRQREPFSSTQRRRETSRQPYNPSLSLTSSNNSHFLSSSALKQHLEPPSFLPNATAGNATMS